MEIYDPAKCGIQNLRKLMDSLYLDNTYGTYLYASVKPYDADDFSDTVKNWFENWFKKNGTKVIFQDTKMLLQHLKEDTVNS